MKIVLGKTRWSLYIGIIVFIIIITSILYKNNNIYGNDEHSIVQLIQSVEEYKNAIIEILEIKDIEDERIVSLLANDKIGYIRFTKNDDGNYEWIDIHHSVGQDIVIFFIPQLSASLEESKLLVITTEFNNVAKLAVDVNGKILKQNIPIQEKSVHWIDLPEGGNYDIGYTYFDEEGNEIVF